MSQNTLQYDPNGCMLQQVQDGQTTKYAWNAQSFLIQTTLPNGDRESYSYCGEGIRRKTQSNAGTRLFIRDGKNILLEADASNATMRRYTRMGDEWGELVSLRQGSTSRFYGFDGSANTRLLTDQNAGVSDSYLYSAFGEELLVTGNSANPLRFGGEVGYYRDTMKRLYIRARHLDVGAGRWMSRDPIGVNGGDFNLYRYVRDNPTNYTDPSGLRPCTPPERAQCMVECASHGERMKGSCDVWLDWPLKVTRCPCTKGVQSSCPPCVPPVGTVVAKPSAGGGPWGWHKMRTQVPFPNCTCGWTAWYPKYYIVSLPVPTPCDAIKFV